MTVDEVLSEARQQGVQLWAKPEQSKLGWRCSGPLSADLRFRLVEQKFALLALLSGLTADEQYLFEERAGIAEFCGHLSRPDAERLAWEQVLATRSQRS